MFISTMWEAKRSKRRSRLCGCMAGSSPAAASPVTTRKSRAPALPIYSTSMTKRLTMKGLMVRDWLDRQAEFEKEVGGYFKAGKVKHKETVVSGFYRAAGTRGCRRKSGTRCGYLWQRGRRIRLREQSGGGSGLLDSRKLFGASRRRGRRFEPDLFWRTRDRSRTRLGTDADFSRCAVRRRGAFSSSPG